MYVGESAGGLKAWHEAIDAVEALKPRWIIESHKDKDRDDDARVIAETRRYLDHESALRRRAACRAAARCGHARR
jgi:hypothetical protein